MTRSEVSKTLRSFASAWAPGFTLARARSIRQAVQASVGKVRSIDVAGRQLWLVDSVDFENRLRSEELPAFLACLPYVDHVIDVGANVGFFTQLALHGGLSVTAVEPGAWTVRKLLRGIDVAGLSGCDVTVVHAAVASAPGIGRLHGEGQSGSLDPNWSGDPGRYPSELVPLVGPEFVWATARPARVLVKVDVEGGEVSIISGLLGAVVDGSPKPIFLFERGRPGSPVDRAHDPLMQELSAAGYTLVPLREDVPLTFDGRAVGLAGAPSSDGTEFNFVALPHDLEPVEIRVGEESVRLAGLR